MVLPAQFAFVASDSQERRRVGKMHLLDLVKPKTICVSGKLEPNEKSSVHQPVRAKIRAAPASRNGPGTAASWQNCHTIPGSRAAGWDCVIALLRAVKNCSGL
jgi:hypothetical protein